MSELERLRSLRAYDILDTPPEASFDRITSLAARLFGVPTVLISIIDEERQWFKSCYGFSTRETSRDLSFCHHAILSSEVMIVEDAREDPRFRSNALVTGEPFIRFYAGAPLIAQDGHALGTLCLIDQVPRGLSEDERARLTELAAMVMESLELRLAGRRLRRAEAHTRAQSEAHKALSRLVTQMVASAELAIISVDCAGLILSWNTAAEALYGYSEAEAKGRHIDLLAPEGEADFDAQMRRIAGGESVGKLELKRRHKAGHLADVSLSISPIFDSQGSIIGASFIAADITERKGEQEALKRYSSRVTTILHSITDAFFSLDGAWRFTYLNPRAERLLKCRKDELMGKEIWRVFPRGVGSRFDAAFKQAMKTRQPAVFEDFYESLGGWLEVHAYPSEEGLSVYFQDITGRKLAEGALQREGDFKDKVMQSVSEAIVALDLRGRFTLVNRRLGEMIGQDSESLAGASFFELFCGENRREVEGCFGRVVASGEVVRLETELRREDGSVATLNLSLSPLAAAGEITGVVATALDISLAKRASDRLRLLEKAVENIDEVVLITDTELGYPGPKIVYVNHAFEKITGYSAGEVVGKTPRILQGPKTDRTVLDRLKRSLAREEPFTARTINYRKDGSDYVIEWHISAVRDEAGKLSHWAAVQRDISQRTEYEAKIIELNNTLKGRLRELDHKNEELRKVARLAEVRKGNFEQAAGELANTARQLHTIFALSPDGFASVDEGGKVAYVNDAFLRMTGLGPEQVIGQLEAGFDRLIRELCDPALPYTSYLVDTETFQDTVRLVRPRPTILQRTVRTLVTDGAELLGRVIYLRDVTHESEVDRMKSEFLSTTAHELRTPMTSIYGFSQLLLERDYDLATSKELIRTIHDQSARLVQLLNELLDLARIEARAGKDFKISRQDLAPIVEGTLRGFDVDGKFELRLELPGALPSVAVDADKMQQVLTNVLSNAFKYSPDGGIIRLDARCERRGGRSWLGVTVADSGIGMSKDQVARIFERFYRADNSGTIPGTGLGMSLVKEIIELHGGSVEVNSERGRGTAVTLWLPVDRS